MPWDEGLVNSLVYDAPDPSEGRVLGYGAAIREALDLALGANASVFVLGRASTTPEACSGRPRGCTRSTAAGGSSTHRCRRKR